MKKKIISICCIALTFVLMRPLVSVAYTIEELEMMSGGTVTDSGEGYYILEKDGKIHYIDENGCLYGEYCITTDSVIDLGPFDNGETDEFLGVKVASITPLFEDDWVEALSEYYYLVVLQDLFAGEAAELVWGANENIVYCCRDAYNSYPDNSLVGSYDINVDGAVDMYDCLMLKSIYFETYEPSAEELSRADVNGDNVVDMYDYLVVKSACFAE